MAFCKNCGTQLDEGTKFCPGCGTQVEENTADTHSAFNGQTQDEQGSPFSQQSANQSAFQDTVTEKFNQFNNTSDTTGEFDPADIEKNKLMGVLSYFSWLVLIPIFAAKDSKFARFHANQGLVLAITEIAWLIIQRVVLKLISAVFSYHLWTLQLVLAQLLSLVNIVFLVFAIIGIINVANGKAKELPIIGKFKILS